MDGMQSADVGSSLVSITVLSVTPARASNLLALASVAIDFDGVVDPYPPIRDRRRQLVPLTTTAMNSDDRVAPNYGVYMPHVAT
jgi:hypothetical protein